MTPYIDAAGAQWAADLFEATNARAKILIMRGEQQMETCGLAGDRLWKVATNVFDYALETLSESGQPSLETFHAKFILADGRTARHARLRPARRNGALASANVILMRIRKGMPVEYRG
jgi:hypothetical protein